MANFRESRLWFESIKSDIISRLEDMTGEEKYLCDIGFSLTESENVNGSWYCSSYKAKEEIFQYWEEFGVIAEYMNSEWECNTNPMLESEKFHCQAMICLYEQAFNHAVCDFEEWNEQVTIDDDFIQRVKDALENAYFDDIF